jgi:hypothetical protein
MMDANDPVLRLPEAPSLEDDDDNDDNEEQTNPQIRHGMESDEDIVVRGRTSSPNSNRAFTTGTSFDSETDDAEGFHLSTTPLHNLLTAQNNPPTLLRPQNEEDLFDDPMIGMAEPDETFEVTDDDSDFEILPDDEDDGEEDAVGKQRRSDEMKRKSVPAALPAESTSTSTNTTCTTTACREKSPERLVYTPQSSPPLSPGPTSPMNSTTASPPLTPQRRFLNSIAVLSQMTREGKSLQVQESESTPADKYGRPPKSRLMQAAADLKSPLPSFKAIKARAIAAYKGGTDGEPTSLATDAADYEDDDGSSSEEFSSDDGSSIGDDSIMFEDDADQVIDFSTLSSLPNSFLNVPPDIYDYLDPDLVKNIGEQDISTFAWEHHLLVKGLLQLLAERDHVGVEGDVHDTSNVLKMGPLKKKSRNLWTVKYVEIRQGNITYYADSTGGRGERKTIHLRKRTCTCQAAAKDCTSGGFVFEVIVEGGPKRLWMAKSEEERQGWIRAINQAMIGETEDSQDVPLDLTPYQSAIEEYQAVQSALQQVKAQQDYLVAVDSLLYRQRSSSALRIPMKWIREQVVQEEEEKRKEPDTAHERVRSTISDFWKKLSNTSVVINGCLVEANSVYSAERVIGALSRCILEFDEVDGNKEIGSIKRAKANTFMTEVEAVSHARSMLTGILRSKSRGDAFSAVEKLVRNDDVVSIQLESSEPLRIDVSFAGDDFSEYEPQPHDLTSWLLTKMKKSKTWKERYFVVSEGVLSFFEKADPRPSGLRGQLVLSNAEVQTIDEQSLQIQTKDNELQLRFDDRAIFVKWRSVLERAADPQNGVESSLIAVSHESRASRRQKKAYIVGNVKPLKGATEAGVKVGKRAMKAMKGAKDAGMKSIKSARGMIARGIRGGPKDGLSPDGSRRRPTTEMLCASTRALASRSKNEKREPTVQAVVELNNVFKVMPTGTSSDEDALL